MSDCLALCEALERRRFFSGNVTVQGGEDFTATITGDRKNNSIEIRLSDQGGYVIKGRSGTSFNGSPELFLQSSTAANLIVSMGAGNDVVSLVGAFNTQSVSIFTGSGNDRVTMSRVSHFGDLNIATERGNDSVTLSDVTATGNLAINTGDGDDSIRFSRVRIDGDSSVNAGRGKNKLSGLNELGVVGTSSVQGIKPAKSHDKKDDEHDEDDD
ncbi:hypothetical protein BH09PLA1_BH09PLA1_16730 [soil metagenome]